MHPIVVFIIILIVIWSMSTAASLANKKKEQERRRRLQWQLQQTAGQTATTPRQISEGIAARFPDVLLPPTPQQRRAVPPRTVKQVIQPRPLASAPPPMRKPARPTVTSQRGRGAGNAMRAPVIQGAIAPPSLPTSSVAPQAASAAPKMARTLAQGVAAPMIKRWLTPETLRQQFILTEIFQPPLALREKH